MQFEGVLSAWDFDSARGLIRPAGGGQELHVFQTDLPTDGAGPVVGERLRFEIVSGRDGCKRAARLQRLHQVASLRTAPASSALTASPRSAGALAHARIAQQKRRRRQLWLGGAAAAFALLATLGLSSRQAAAPHAARPLIKAQHTDTAAAFMA